jgi:hypothetical protein
MKQKIKSKAGRKPALPGLKKKMIRLFVEENTIDYFGDMEICKKILYNRLKERS